MNKFLEISYPFLLTYIFIPIIFIFFHKFQLSFLDFSLHRTRNLPSIESLFTGSNDERLAWKLLIHVYYVLMSFFFFFKLGRILQFYINWVFVELGLRSFLHAFIQGKAYLASTWLSFIH